MHPTTKASCNLLPATHACTHAHTQRQTHTQTDINPDRQTHTHTHTVWRYGHANLIVHDSSQSPLSPQLVPRVVHKQQQVVLGVDQVAHRLQDDGHQLVQAAAACIDVPEGLVQLRQPLLLSPAPCKARSVQPALWLPAAAAATDAAVS